jgi:hypothetical protein
MPVPGSKVLGASSFLPDKADVFVRHGVIRKVGFDAARLFYGIRETALAEGKPGDGVGEFVSFSLDRPVWKVAVRNGYLRSPIDIPEKATWSYFEKNNRVSSLQIEKIMETRWPGSTWPIRATSSISSWTRCPVPIAP